MQASRRKRCEERAVRTPQHLRKKKNETFCAPPGKRGFLDFNWFWLSFFFLIVVIALSLLFLEKDSLRPERKQLNEDFANQRADAMLVNTLRLPATLDIDGDGKEEEGTLGQLIAVNTGQYDDRIKEALAAGLKGDWHYRVTVEYPGDRKIDFENDLARYIPGFEAGNAGALLPCTGGTVHVILDITTQYPLNSEKKRISDEALRMK